MPLDRQAIDQEGARSAADGTPAGVPTDARPADSQEQASAAAVLRVPGTAPGGRPPRTRLAVTVGVGGLLLLGLLLALQWPSPRPVGAPAIGTRPAVAVASTTAVDPRQLPEAPFVGQRAPNFTLPDLGARPVILSNYRGHPLWINMWATWCPPCRVEMPEMKKLYARYKAQGLVVLGVDMREDQATVATFVRANDYDWQFVLDRDGVAAGKYYVTGLPTHVFVDQAGIIRVLQVGGLTPEAMEANVTRILHP